MGSWAGQGGGSPMGLPWSPGLWARWGSPGRAGQGQSGLWVPSGPWQVLQKGLDDSIFKFI